MKTKRQVLRDDRMITDGIRGEELNVTITDNESGEVLFNENVSNISFTALEKYGKERNTHFGAMAGTFNVELIIESLRHTIATGIQNMKRTYGIEAAEAMMLISEIATQAMKENYTQEEFVKSALKVVKN